MSVNSEITRLTEARDRIRIKLTDLGLADSTYKLDALADSIDTIENKGAISASVTEGTSYTIPRGYHNGSGTVTGVSGGGNYSLQTKTVTPTKAQQAISSDEGYYGLSSVTVEAIPEAYQNVSSVTATASDVLTTKVFVTKTGVSTAGTMANNGAVSATLNTTTTSYTVPTGYHNGNGKVSITLEDKGTITPTTSTQTITPTTGKVISQVKVAGDANLTAGNIKSGATIFNTEGTFTSSDTVSSGQTAAAAGNIISGYSAWVDGAEVKGTIPTKSSTDISASGATVSFPAGYYSEDGSKTISSGALSDITVSTTGLITAKVGTAGYLATTTSKTKQLTTKGTTTITPTTSSQTAIASGTYATGNITVAAIPAKFVNSETVTATAGNVLAGTKAVVKTGASTWAVADGTMIDQGTLAATITGLGAVAGDTSYTLSAGYYAGGSVSLTSDIENQLASI